MLAPLMTFVSSSPETEPEATKAWRRCRSPALEGTTRRATCPGAREIRLRLPQGESGIGVIDYDQDVAVLDLLAVDDIHRRDRSVDLRGNHGDLGGRVGVVGRHIA